MIAIRVHGLEQGHGDERAARAPCERTDSGRVSGSSRSEHPLSRLDRTRHGLGQRDSLGPARPCFTNRSLRIDPRPVAPGNPRLSIDGREEDPPLYSERAPGSGRPPRAEEPDHRQRRLLRMRGERPKNRRGCRTAKERNKFRRLILSQPSAGQPARAQLQISTSPAR